MNSKIVLFGAVIALAVAVYFILPSAGLSTDTASPDTASLGEPAHSNREVLAIDGPEAQAPSVEQSELEPQLGDVEKREPVELDAVYKGFVHDFDGAPIDGAVVSITPIPRDLIQLSASFQNYRLFAEEHSEMVTTGEDGEFNFEQLPTLDSKLGFVVWISHTDFAPAYAVLKVQRDQWIQSTRTELAAEGSRRVSVVDSETNGVEGATVEQVGITNSVEAETKEFDRRLAWLLHRRVVTDSKGKADLHIFPGQQELQASKEELRSAPWEGEVSGEVTLKLQTTIRVDGIVNRLPGVEAESELLIGYEAIVGAQVITLGETRTTENIWGPVDLPFIEGAEYVFRLKAENLVRTESVLHPKRVGESFTVELEARIGKVIWFYVSDTEGNPLPGAEAELQWTQDGRKVSKQMGMHPDYEGYMAVDGCPDGVLRGEFRCEGYETEILPALNIPAPKEVSLEIELRRGSVLKGTCLLDGEPVENFELSVWPASHPSESIQHRFTDTSDGTFEVRGARLAELGLAAAVQGVGFSNIALVSAVSGRVDGIVLNLTTGLSAKGTVVDFVTGLPVVGAVVQPLFSDRRNSAGLFGRQIPVDSDGQFHLAGLQAGESKVRVSAPGYSTTEVSTSTASGQESDFGVIRLSRRKPLVIEVMVAEELNVADLRVFVDGLENLGYYTPDARGIVEFDSFEAGHYYFGTVSPSGASHTRTMTLSPEEESWHVLLDLTESSSLSIEVYPEESRPLPSNLVVQISGYNEEGLPVRITGRTDEQGRLTQSFLGGATYEVLLYGDATADFKVYGRQSVELGYGDNQTVQFQIGEEARKILVVDELGNPIGNANVGVSEPGGDSLWSGRSFTDPDGVFEVFGYTADRMHVHLSHPKFGGHLGIDVELGPVDELTTLVLAGALDIEFVLQDAAGPLVGAEVSLYDPEFLFRLGPIRTDSQGKVTWRNLTATELGVRFRGEGYWPIYDQFKPSENAAPIVLTALRTCKLTIGTVTNGKPRPDIALDLALTETRWDTGHYIGTGRIKSDQPELRTGPNGKIHLDGVPEGNATWRVWLTGDDQIYDTIEILANTPNRLVIEVPE